MRVNVEQIALEKVRFAFIHKVLLHLFRIAHGILFEIASIALECYYKFDVEWCKYLKMLHLLHCAI